MRTRINNYLDTCDNLSVFLLFPSFWLFICLSISSRVRIFLFDFMKFDLIIKDAKLYLFFQRSV